MAQLFIKDLEVEAETIANDDYLVLDGATNKSRKYKTFNGTDQLLLLNTVGKAAISNFSMPSSIYSDLTLGASGSNYTAPADGYLTLYGITTSTAVATVSLLNLSNGITSYPVIYGVTGTPLGVFMPVKKGQTMQYGYVNVNVTRFRFIYAEGSKP